MLTLGLNYFEKGYALSNYIRKQNYNDILSDTIRLMKNNIKFNLEDKHEMILQHWINLLYTSISETGIKFDIVMRMLGHDEVIILPNKPLHIMAKRVASLIGASFQTELLIKNKVTPTQRSNDIIPDVGRRKLNIKDAYCVGKDYINIENKNILIIDDVFTTGASLTEVGRVLKEANPGNQLYFFALACYSNSSNVKSIQQ
jgi:predicted amidophosphoribosyltransferase